MNISEIWVDRDNYRNTKIVAKDAPKLQDGEILVKLDQYGLTSNNVSYAASGDMIGYWKYFPVETDGTHNWGKVPVWGLADVVESRCEDITVGERLYGFFPMDTHTVLKPGKIRSAQFTDMADHRQNLPTFYNNYSRTKAEPEFMKPLDIARCLLFPLYVTGFGIADYLEDNAFFNAEQIIIGSASSKTGFSTAAFLTNIGAFKGKVIGLTSPSNKAFVQDLGDCDQVVTYGNETDINTELTSCYVDMSGNTDLRATLHNLLEDKMVSSITVGGTHWEDRADGGTALPGAKPQFFFYPAHIAKRDNEWGRGKLLQKAFMGSAQLAARTKDQLAVEFLKGPEAAREIWLDMLDNKVSPKRGIMVAINASS